MTDFDPQKIFEVLDEYEIDFVVIGAMAAVLQGAGLAATFDVDVAAATTDDNRNRLALALRAMDARLRLGPGEEPVPLPIDGRMLARVSVMTFLTKYGPFDVLFDPHGAPPYETLRERAHMVKRAGITFRAAAIEDVIAMKRAAGREKDAVHVALLLEYLEKRDR